MYISSQEITRFEVLFIPVAQKLCEKSVMLMVMGLSKWAKVIVSYKAPLIIQKCFIFLFPALFVCVLDLPVTGYNVLSLQSQISILEQAHSQRLMEVTAHLRQELDLESERMRNSQQQVEKALEAREKAHRQRVHCLEEQVWESYEDVTTCIIRVYIYITFDCNNCCVFLRFAHWKNSWSRRWRGGKHIWSKCID